MVRKHPLVRMGAVHAVTRKDGGVLEDRHLYKLFWTATYRLAGVKTNPHLVRDSIVTFLR